MSYCQTHFHICALQVYSIDRFRYLIKCLIFDDFDKSSLSYNNQTGTISLPAANSGATNTQKSSTNYPYAIKFQRGCYALIQIFTSHFYIF
jgi:hypothetical protein